MQNFLMINTRGIVYRALFLRSCCRKLWWDAHTKLSVLHRLTWCGFQCR